MLQKLKKLIKAQKAHMDQGLEGGAPAEAASGRQRGGGRLMGQARQAAAVPQPTWHPLQLAAASATLFYAGAQCGASSDDEDMPGAPPARAAAAAAAAGDEPGDASGGVAEEDREFIATLNEVRAGRGARAGRWTQVQPCIAAAP